MSNSNYFDQLTPAEIELMAKKYIEAKEEEYTQTEFAIKENKKNGIKDMGSKATRVITAGAITLMCAKLIFDAPSNAANLGTNDLMNMIQGISNSIGNLNLPGFKYINIINVKSYEGINYLLNGLGIIGLIAASNAVKTISGLYKGGKKAHEIKRNDEYLKEKLNELGKEGFGPGGRDAK